MWGDIGRIVLLGNDIVSQILNVRYKNIMTNSTILTLFLYICDLTTLKYIYIY